MTPLLRTWPTACQLFVPPSLPSLSGDFTFEPTLADTLDVSIRVYPLNVKLYSARFPK